MQVSSVDDRIILAPYVDEQEMIGNLSIGQVVLTFDKGDERQIPLYFLPKIIENGELVKDSAAHVKEHLQDLEIKADEFKQKVEKRDEQKDLGNEQIDLVQKQVDKSKEKSIDEEEIQIQKLVKQVVLPNSFAPYTNYKYVIRFAGMLNEFQLQQFNQVAEHLKSLRDTLDGEESDPFMLNNEIVAAINIVIIMIELQLDISIKDSRICDLISAFKNVQWPSMMSYALKSNLICLQDMGELMNRKPYICLQSEEILAQMQNERNDYVEKMKIFKILVVGCNGVGKTSCIRQIIYRSFNSDYKSTLGVDQFYHIMKLRFNGQQRVGIYFWDIAGQERYSNLTRAYYKDAQGCFVVGDLGVETFLNDITQWKRDVDQKITFPQTSEKIPCFLLCNKIDKQYIRQSFNEQLKLNLQVLQFDRIYGTSAATGEGLKDALKEMCQLILLKLEQNQAMGNDLEDRGIFVSEQKQYMTRRGGGCC